jgi:hypothetical protein
MGYFYGGIDSYTKLMLHCNGVDASTTFTDDEITPKAVTAVGNAQIDTAQKVFGTGSGLFDGTGDYLSVVDHADWDFGSGNFTIDFRVRFAAFTEDHGDNAMIFDHGDDDDHRICLNYVSATWWYFIVTDGTTKALYTWAVTHNVDTWYHIALIRNATTMDLYVNGIALAKTETTAISTNSVGSYAAAVLVGINKDTAGQPFNGWLDEYRVSTGIARWTANFTPPDDEYWVTTATTNSLFYPRGRTRFPGSITGI